MTIINTVSSSRFSLNGVQYLKNYISAVHGSRVEIFNCYERADVLVPLTLYTQVSLNGTVYGNASLLQAALLDVIYSRATLGLAGLEDQDNIDIKKTFRYTPGESTTSILSKINNLASYTVNERQSVWFIGSQSVRLSPVTGGGTALPLPQFPSLEPDLTINLNPAIVKYKMLNKGKGIYGQGGIQLTASNIELMYTSQATSQELEDDPQTDFINFTLAPGQTIVQWLNSRSPALAIQPQDDGYTIFKGFDATGDALSYLWLGEAATYGVGQQPAIASYFQQLEDTAPAQPVPTWQHTLAVNPISDIAPGILDPSTGNLMKLGGNRMAVTFSNGKTLTVNYQQIEDSNFSLTAPEVVQNESFAYHSWVLDRINKNIKVIPGAAYTLLAEDTAYILHFTSTDAVTLTVPVGLPGKARYECKQMNTGKVSVVGASVSTGGVTTTAVVNKYPDFTNKTAGPYAVFALDCTATNEYVIYGTLELV